LHIDVTLREIWCREFYFTGNDIPEGNFMFWGIVSVPFHWRCNLSREEILFMLLWNNLQHRYSKVALNTDFSPLLIQINALNKLYQCRPHFWFNIVPFIVLPSTFKICVVEGAVVDLHLFAPTPLFCRGPGCWHFRIPIQRGARERLGRISLAGSVWSSGKCFSWVRVIIKVSCHRLYVCLFVCYECTRRLWISWSGLEW
jgi:hypothetical protein